MKKIPTLFKRDFTQPGNPIVAEYNDVPIEFEALKTWLTDKDIEGIVWHHPDGRMVKIKKKDFRLKRETS